MGITVIYRGMLQEDLERRQNSDEYVNSDEVTKISQRLGKSYDNLHPILTGGLELDQIDKNNVFSRAILGWNEEEDSNWGDGWWWWESWVSSGYNDAGLVQEIAMALNSVDFSELYDKSGYDLKYKKKFTEEFQKLKVFYQACAENGYAVEADFW